MTFMIEVEKKFILTDEQERSLIHGAQFLGVKEFIDVYYDDSNYSLTKRDIWLRSREGKFELKIPINESIEKRVSDQYRELENLEDILKYFKVSTGASFENFLKEKNYNAFCRITTTRKKYKKDEFNIDLDVMDFGYTLAEIEYMANNESEIGDATKAIVRFAERFGINSNDTIRGKVIEYLKRNNPVHFQELINAKVIT
ncbi:MAG: hypothetical protein COU90_02470 [Candidatus Ryanbacteria bacterium CG10_big_fil_rev_8_21_14_0_10_43_42]|uniref:CYTH domain-containing protein n=1 Tax=Candidatus Ryanbacteria bacterium CG10_big_fil_rev_8_21_14_0_10_43_42 TaxID=1974864 RepID=A0A2M8KWL6_9BACT|nr:MAG: hypothetical protein COU90_02470 [Candidatus Ryanbacteria bacterium CG10_big_fil_rev_8_21_14_0_10_43_42]